jgi:hypothetical protein
MKTYDQIQQEKLEAAMGRIANAFLKWELPESVRADPCATSPDPRGYRTGTNLLTFVEAMEMARAVVLPVMKEVIFEYSTPDEPGEVFRHAGTEKRGDHINPETHPFRGLVVKVYAPGCFFLDRKPFCENSWNMRSRNNQMFGVQNSKEDCLALIEHWGATAEIIETLPEPLRDDQPERPTVVPEAPCHICGQLPSEPGNINCSAIHATPQPAPSTGEPNDGFPVRSADYREGFGDGLRAQALIDGTALSSEAGEVDELRARCAEYGKDINGILEECAKHITLSNDFPWSEEVHCAFNNLRQQIAETEKERDAGLEVIDVLQLGFERALCAVKSGKPRDADQHLHLAISAIDQQFNGQTVSALRAALSKQTEEVAALTKQHNEAVSWKEQLYIRLNERRSVFFGDAAGIYAPQSQDAEYWREEANKFKLIEQNAQESCTRLSSLNRELQEENGRLKERIERGLTHLYEECEGYEDGTPDAPAVSRLANRILPTIRSLLAVARAASQPHGTGEGNQGAMTLKRLEDALCSCGVIETDAILFPEDYDSGLTKRRVSHAHTVLRAAMEDRA